MMSLLGDPRSNPNRIRSVSVIHNPNGILSTNSANLSANSLVNKFFFVRYFSPIQDNISNSHSFKKKFKDKLTILSQNKKKTKIIYLFPGLKILVISFQLQFNTFQGSSIYNVKQFYTTLHTPGCTLPQPHAFLMKLEYYRHKILEFYPSRYAIYGPYRALFFNASKGSFFPFLYIYQF